MVQTTGLPDPERHARYEVFEERLVLSSDPLDLFLLDPTERLELGSESLHPDYVELAPTILDVELPALQSTAASFGLTGAGQTVAIIDSGIAYDHVALGNGFGAGHRVVGGWDFAENDANPYDDGPAGFHGTHVAGIVGSTDSRYTGVAPGADLVALRVFDDQGRGSLAWVERALQWVYNNRGSFENPITTVNLSLGTNWNSTSVPNWSTLEDEFQRLEQAGIFVSVAAGNSFQNYRTPGLSYPAASPYVVPVASHGASGAMSEFSQRTTDVLVAPGERIMSTIPAHLFGATGPSTRFLAASGTSMAAPYVAGAAVLVRQAMDMLGYQEINQDRIEDHLRSTADVIYDAVTKANYHRVNLTRALDALMADDYGNTASDAHNLGTVSNTANISGVLGSSSDVDAFSFVASRTGRMQISLSSLSSLDGRVQVLGEELVSNGGALEFQVQAGQRYVLAVDSLSGVGGYRLDLELTTDLSVTPPVDLGVVSSTTVSAIQLQGESWYRFVASRSGVLTLEASGGTQSDWQVELLGEGMQRLGLTAADRLDVQVVAGQSYLLKLSGERSGVDLKLTNLVQREGTLLSVSGTDGDDLIRIETGNATTVTVDGTVYQFSNTEVRRIELDGGAGNDSIQMIGNNGYDWVTVSDAGVTWNRWNLNVRAQNFESIRAEGTGGPDRLTVIGSEGDDSFHVAAGRVGFEGGGKQLDARGFRDISIQGGGGEDHAELYGTTGRDRLISKGSDVTLSSTGFVARVQGVNRVSVDASQGGFDVANLHDTQGDDAFEIGPNFATVTGSNYSLTTSGFTQVFAFASLGQDSVRIHDTAGADRLEASPGNVRLTGGSYVAAARGFDAVTVTATGHAGDLAILRGSTGSDFVDSSLASTTLSGANYRMTAEGFRRVSLHAVAGGLDEVLFRDSIAAERFYGSATYASLNDGVRLVGAHGFQRVQAISTAGGNDFALIHGTSAFERVTTGRSGAEMLGGRFRLQALGFSEVQIQGGGGGDVATLAELAAHDAIFGRARLAQANYDDAAVKMYGFALVQAMVTTDNEPTADVSAVDYVFRRLKLT